MNREKFHQQLSEPAILGSDSLQELEALTNEFPWFQGGRMLFLKALHNTENLSYPEALKKTAVYLSERKTLYTLIHSVKKVAVQQVAIKETPKKVSEFIEEKKKELQSTSVTEQLAGTIKTETDKKSAAELLANSLTEEQKKKTPLDTLGVTGKKQEPVVDAESEILESTRSIDQVKRQKTDFDEIKKAEADLTSISENITADAIQAGYESHAIEIKDREAEEIVSIENAEQLRKKIGLSKKLDFAAWLKAIDEGVELAEEVSEKPVSSSTVENLIDKFITEEPRMSKPKKEFYSPVNMAKQSVLDDENLVTETLARIYMKQEKYQKAIRAYEVLSLKFPDKKRYFAALIEEIRNKESN